jgi:hypothetical protein
LCLILKIHHNFESYQIMLITLDFFFLYHKLQFCFVSHSHYTLFTYGKGLLKFQKYFKFQKNSIPYLQNCEWFLNVCNRLLLPTIFYHQNYIITSYMGLKQFQVQIVFVFFLFLFIEKCIVSNIFGLITESKLNNWVAD